MITSSEWSSPVTTIHSPGKIKRPHGLSCPTLSVSAIRSKLRKQMAHIALLCFVRGSAMEKFKEIRNVSHQHDGGVTCLPEAKKYLLRTYATSETLQAAILTLRDIHQKSDGDERAYCTRPATAPSRCANIRSSDEKTTTHVDGLHDDIKTLVASSRETGHVASILEVVQFAQVERDCARLRRRGTGWDRNKISLNPWANQSGCHAARLLFWNRKSIRTRV